MSRLIATQAMENEEAGVGKKHNFIPMTGSVLDSQRMHKVMWLDQTGNNV